MQLKTVNSFGGHLVSILVNNLLDLINNPCELLALTSYITLALNMGDIQINFHP